MKMHDDMMRKYIANFDTLQKKTKLITIAYNIYH
jgi:hypothetical protein